MLSVMNEEKQNKIILSNSHQKYIIENSNFMENFVQLGIYKFISNNIEESKTIHTFEKQCY